MASAMTPPAHTDHLTTADLGEVAGIVEGLAENRAQPLGDFGPIFGDLATTAVRWNAVPQLKALAVLLRQLAAAGVTFEGIGTPDHAIRYPYTWCDTCGVAHDGQGRTAPKETP